MQAKAELERKIFPVNRDGFRLSLFPSDPSLFWISPVAQEILDLSIKPPKVNVIKSLYKKYDGEKVTRVMEEIKFLQRKGFFNKTRRNLWAKVKFPKEAKDIHIFSMNLHLTHACNLNCSYCYASKGNFGLNIPERLMSWKVAKRSIDWLFDLNKDRHGTLSICFFGGEPLLNIGVMEKALRYIEQEKKPHYPGNIMVSTMTNGVLLKERKVREVLTRYSVKPTISLDANKDSHDQNRPYKGGRGSYHDVVEGIRMLKKMAPELPIIVRSVIYSQKDLKDYFAKKESLGVLGVEFSIRYDLMFSKNKIDGLLKTIRQEFARYTKEVLSGNKRPIFLTSALLQFFHGNILSSENCGAGINKVSIIPNGDIHICSGTNLDNNLTYLGDISTGIRDGNLQKLIKLYDSLKDRSDYCSDCWARHYCPGICILTRKFGNINNSNNKICDFMRMITEFLITSYALMGHQDLNELAKYNTYNIKEKTKLSISQKVRLLNNVREIYNQNLNYLKLITPAIPN